MAQKGETSTPENTSRRVRTLTPKAQEVYLDKVNRYEFIISRCIDEIKNILMDIASCSKQIKVLTSSKTDLENSHKRYQDIYQEFSEFLSNTYTKESIEKLASVERDFLNIDKKVQNALVKLQDDIDFVQLETYTSTSHNTSKSTSLSRRSVRSLQKAKEAETRLKIAEQSAQLKKQKSKIAVEEKIHLAQSQQQQEDLDTELDLLQKQAELELANMQLEFELEAEGESIKHEDLGPNMPTIPSISGDQKTRNFVDNLTLNQDVKPSGRRVRTNYQQEAIPDSDKENHPVHTSDVCHHDQQSRDNDNRTPLQTALNLPLQNNSNSSNYLLKKNLLLESFQQQRFDDKSDRYVVWKSQFKTMVSEICCSPLEEMTLLTNCTNKNSEAHRLIMSLRASYASDPKLCLVNIWKRMDERFGSPELLESSLKSRLQAFTNFTDPKKLYELHDLLCEIQAVKSIPEYSVMFSYLDSSLGLKPTIQQLPRFLQDKWINRVVNYKKEHSTAFPPFGEFVSFIGEMSIIRNDPGLMFDTSKQPRFDRKDTKVKTVFTHKTDISSETTNVGHICLIHKGSKHTINKCKAFRTKSIEDRKHILRDHNICFRCCETSDHFANRCKARILCDVCKSNYHCTALHEDVSYRQMSRNFPSPQTHGEEENFSSGIVNQSVTTKCTDICCEFSGKSCARIVPVRVFVQGQPESSILTYAMLDDQSNRTLGKSYLFDALCIKTMAVDYTMQSCSGKIATRGRIVDNLIVESINDNRQLKLPPVLECDSIPNSQAEIPTPDIALHYPHLQDIARDLHPLDPSMEILLLIGRDLPEAHHVIDQRLGPSRFPFAQQSPLGWTIIGDICLAGKHIPSLQVNRTYVDRSGRPTMLEPCTQMLNIKNTVITSNKTVIEKTDVFTKTSDDNKVGLSIEDHTFLNIMDNKFHLDPTEGKWTAPLPFRQNREQLPDNYSQALFRAKCLDASLRKNNTKKEHFIAFMQKIFDCDHAELAPIIPPDKEHWYLPLFGVYHPRKPDQIRGVFDSSAEFKGVSLNEQLLQGPDFINNLLGILIRFRKENVAVVADIQSMFHSFLVDEDHRDYLRFMWHRDNDIERPLITYRMKVHVFGNRSSPSVAMYGLRRIGDLAAESHGQEVKDFIVNDFYVDDGLKSCATTREAINILQKTKDAMKEYGGLRLHKFASNEKEVMEAFDSNDLSKNIVDLNFEKDVLTQSSLGLLWDLQTDTIRFKISSEDKPSTRRGVLSVVNRLYDPLGFIAPVVIQGKIILRKVVSNTSSWDEALPEHLLKEWEKWKNNLPDLENLRIPRVIVPKLCEALRRELLVYCDASELAIAAVCYLKAKYSDGSSSQGFVLGKAKVAPVSGHTIPRLELCAAVLATDIAQIAKEQLKVKIDDIKFFSDSRIVLGYINNTKKRFLVYVANRIAHIHSLSSPTQWYYIRSEMNPADVSTRGILPNEMEKCAWLSNIENVEIVPSIEQFPLVSPEEDKEIRCNKTDIETKTAVGLDNELLTRFSKWNKLVAVLAKVYGFIQNCRNPKSKLSDVQLLHNVETVIIRDIQKKFYLEEIENIRDSKPVSRNSSIQKLDPYIDSERILRVGGRLKKYNDDPLFKNPIILPAKHHVTTLIVRKLHEDVRHQGRHITEGHIRSSGFWIVGGKRLISSVLHKCVTCRKLRKKPEHQKMSDLPEDRLIPGQPPFSSVGVDIFGPWNIITRRTRGGVANSKRWAALFTCLTTRAVHIEVVEEMTSSSFINAFRRLIAIRGPVQVLRSDRGTNFIGAAKELKVNVINVEEDHLHNFLNEQRTTWIFNPPHSSHMGGVWERMIGTTRRILDAILLDYGSRSLTHEVLTTFLAEASSIINSRPLVPVSTDPENPLVLSPSTLLTQKTSNKDVIFADHENKNELLQTQWRRVQHLASIFWKRWKTEYLNTLQMRRKWNSHQRNLSPGDVVLICDKELSRNSWPLGIVTKALPSDDELVRKVTVRVIVNGEPKNYVRPITELIVILEQ